MSSTFQKILILSVIIGLLLITGCKLNEDKDNTDPEINSVTVTPSTINVNGTATVTVDADDDDGDNLTYSYVPSGGAIVGNTASVPWTAPSMAGTYSVTVTVDDGNDGEDQGSAALTVTAPPVVTRVTGTAAFGPGIAGDLSNAQVSLYTSIANWNNYSPVAYGAVVGSGASVTFSLDVVPGNYLLDIWKDNDASFTWSIDDFVGWWGSGALSAPFLTEFQVIEGQTLVFTINMVTI